MIIITVICYELECLGPGTFIHVHSPVNVAVVSRRVLISAYLPFSKYALYYHGYSVCENGKSNMQQHGYNMVTGCK